MSFEEIKKILEIRYKDYFKILDLNIQARELIFISEDQWKPILLKNLKNAIECEKIEAEQTAYLYHNFYKSQYEKKLKIYNNILKKEKEI